MKFLFDEGADIRLADYLISLSHDVTSIVRHYARPLEDTDVLSIAYEEGRILITEDRDFGELVFLHRQSHSGVIFLRLPVPDLEVKIQLIDHLLGSYADYFDQFIVVTLNRIRVRMTRNG